MTQTLTGSGRLVLDQRFDFPPGEDPASIPRIEPAAAQQKAQNGSAILVDVRGARSFEELHVAGAINVPLLEVARKAPTLSHSQTVIAYCACPAEESSARAALELKKLGFPGGMALHRGLDAWKKAGLPVEKGRN